MKTQDSPIIVNPFYPFYSPEKIHITWSKKSISKREDIMLRDIVNGKFRNTPGCLKGYRYLSESDAEDVRMFLNRNKGTFPDYFSVSLIFSMRSALNQLRAINGHWQVLNKKRELAIAYDRGVDILSLSKKYNYPPVAIMRFIFTERGMGKGSIKNALQDPEELNKRDRSQVIKAHRNDIVTSSDQTGSAEAGKRFEEAISKILDKHEIRYITEEDIKEGDSNPPNTPDFLIVDDLYVNGKLCRWIEVKNFYGADVNYIKNRTKKQVDRYIKAYGDGCIIYSLGFCETLRFNSVQMLDGSRILRS